MTTTTTTQTDLGGVKFVESIDGRNVTSQKLFRKLMNVCSNSFHSTQAHQITVTMLKHTHRELVVSSSSDKIMFIGTRNLSSASP